MTSQQRRIVDRFNKLKPWVGVEDAVCLKSYGPFVAPLNCELVPAVLQRLGHYAAEVVVNGQSWMVPPSMVCVVAAERRGMQPPRRDEMCPTSGEKRRPTPPPCR